jgi:lipopolysaccharide transport system ATP-binding protein
VSAEVIIHAREIGKLYRLGRRQGYKTLRESVTDLVAGPFRRYGSNGRAAVADESILWALKDLSFELKRGEVMGIIGSNGAGKSTLLKVLSRITEPTEGVVEIKGRVGSLLEVGTGFHPELTGRENIYLNGAILGMKRREIDSKFDAIVAFSEVERFLDTPVKHYSSGMYVRLAFAVAAHLEPDVLLVDEVLAVGDAAFQKKCLGKIEEVSGSGRTVLLVSHNMAAIKALASTAMWLERGRIKAFGEPLQLVNQYLAVVDTDSRSGFYNAEQIEAQRVRHEKYLRKLKLQSVTLKNDSGNISGIHFEGATLRLDLGILSSGDVEALEIFVRVKTLDGQLIFTGIPEKRYMKISPGAYTAVVRFGIAPLLPGTYQGDVVLLSNLPQDNVSPAFRFEVAPNPECPGDERTVLLPSAIVTTESSHRALGLIRVRASLEDFAKAIRE